jgi:hypothetical protein
LLLRPLHNPAFLLNTDLAQSVPDSCGPGPYLPLVYAFGDRIDNAKLMRLQLIVMSGKRFFIRLPFGGFGSVEIAGLAIGGCEQRICFPARVSSGDGLA